MGDLIRLATRTKLPDAQARAFQPRVVLVDADNRIVHASYQELPGPAVRAEA